MQNAATGIFSHQIEFVSHINDCVTETFLKFIEIQSEIKEKNIRHKCANHPAFILGITLLASAVSQQGITLSITRTTLGNEKCLIAHWVNSSARWRIRPQPQKHFPLIV